MIFAIKSYRKILIEMSMNIFEKSMGICESLIIECKLILIGKNINFVHYK